MQQAEDDARDQLLEMRNIQRKEREVGREAELEQKKHDAWKRREKEHSLMEAARRKEKEMLDCIADAEIRRAVREEEERIGDEEERLAQERYEVSTDCSQVISSFPHVTR